MKEIKVGQKVKIKSVKSNIDCQHVYNNCCGEVTSISGEACYIKLDFKSSERIRSLKEGWVTDPRINIVFIFPLRSRKVLEIL